MGNIDFAGKTLVVTGAGRGLGRAYVLALAQRGASVVVNDYGVDVDGKHPDDGPAETVTQEIIAAGGKAVACFASVTTKAGADTIIRTALEHFGRIDVLINNAGIVSLSPFDAYPDGMFEQHLDIHVRGSWNMAQRAWGEMKKRRGGRIINTLSLAGYYGQANNSAYATCKAGLMGLTRSLALEGQVHGIIVNGFAPGGMTRMATPFVESLPPEQRETVSAMLSVNDPTALLLYLAHESCKTSGRFYSAMGGRVAQHQLMETIGLCTAPGTLTPELIAQEQATIDNMDNGFAPESVDDVGIKLQGIFG